MMVMLVSHNGEACDKNGIFEVALLLVISQRSLDCQLEQDTE